MGQPLSAKHTKMEKIQELRAARAGKIDALDALIKKMGVDDYVENDVDTQVYDEIKKDVGDLDKKIARTEEVDKLKASLATPVDGQAKVFATPRKRFTKLKAFKGPDAEENAYSSGSGSRRRVRRRRLQAVVPGQRHRHHPRAVGRRQLGRRRAGAEPDDGSIIDLREEFGVFRKNAQIVPMSSTRWTGRAGRRSDCLLHGGKYRGDGKLGVVGQRQPGGEEARGAHPHVNRAQRKMPSSALPIF
jgi:hypothetical protein